MDSTARGPDAVQTALHSRTHLSARSCWAAAMAVEVLGGRPRLLFSHFPLPLGTLRPQLWEGLLQDSRPYFLFPAALALYAATEEVSELGHRI